MIRQASLAASLICTLAAGLLTSAPALAENPPPGIFMLDDNIDNSACTTVAISPDGIMLTALHCLRNCLRQQGRMESTSSSFIGLNELDVATRPQAPQLCSKISIKSLGVRSVMVLATGTSLVQMDPQFFLTYTSYFADLHAKGFDAMNDDFAVIQVSAQNLPCGKLSPTDIAPNAHLAALGFQQQENDPSSLIYNETPGFRYSSSDQSAYSRLKSVPEFARFVAQLFDHTDFIYSSAPIKEGQSGGPVIGDSREIAGLVSGHTISAQGVNELFAVPLSHVMDKLPVVLANNLRTKNATCRSTF